MRLALGASRWRIVRQLLVESVVLAAVAGVLRLGLSYGGIQIFWSFAAQSAPPYWLRFPIDRAVFAYLAVICLGSSILCGLVPAWQASRRAIVATLNDMGRTSAGGRSGRRWTGVVRCRTGGPRPGFAHGGNVDDPVPPQSNADGHRSGHGPSGANGAQRVDLYLRHARAALAVLQTTLEEALASIGSTQAVLASHAPLAGAVVRRPLIEGRPPADAGALPPVSVLNVGQRYFEVVGTVLTQGRMFTAADMRTGSEAVVVNQQFAKTNFQDESVIVTCPCSTYRP